MSGLPTSAESSKPPMAPRSAEPLEVTFDVGAIGTAGGVVGLTVQGYLAHKKPPPTTRTAIGA